MIGCSLGKDTTTDAYLAGQDDRLFSCLNVSVAANTFFLLDLELFSYKPQS